MEVLFRRPPVPQRSRKQHETHASGVVCGGLWGGATSGSLSCHFSAQKCPTAQSLATKEASQRGPFLARAEGGQIARLCLSDFGG